MKKWSTNKKISMACLGMALIGLTVAYASELFR